MMTAGPKMAEEAVVIETMMVTCAGCGGAFRTPLQVDRATLEALVITEQYECPHCGRVATYVKADHFHRLELQDEAER